MNLPRTNDLPNYITKGELAKQLYPELTYDTALPQGWVDAVTTSSFDPRGCVVWGYPKGSCLGAPYPLTVEADEALRLL